jgi:hypothetical protein
LGHNALEGGAALCAAALLDAEAAAAAQTAAAMQAAPWPGAEAANSTGAYQGFFCGQEEAEAASQQAQQAVERILRLDGNPLGASGVQILMRTIAGQSAVTLNSCLAANAASTAASSASGTADGTERQQRQQQQDPAAGAAPVHLSIDRVSLLSQEKGFRSSMRSSEAALGFCSQVGRFFFLGSYTWAQSPKQNWHCPPWKARAQGP